MYLYQNINDHIRILGCRGFGGAVKIPKKIENLPVTELADYAFSDGWGKNSVISQAGDTLRLCDDEGNPVTGKETNLPPELLGNRLVDINLPETIDKIGNYAFYNCFELSHLECYSSISDLGSGLFTGCSKIRNLDLHIMEGRRSCMQGIVSELRQELLVNYHMKDKTARLLFPEMYEESVEHTPARIVFREMHGCGHMYRYCFDQSEFQFHKYDALFPHVRIQESAQVASVLALLRLYTPLQLLEKNRKVYEDYVTEHFDEAGEAALNESELFLWLAETYGNGQPQLDRLIDLASETNNAELLSPLMDLRHRRFPAKKRTFTL